MEQTEVQPGIPDPIWFRTVCQSNGLAITHDQLQKLEQYVALLLEWNGKVNLISRTDTGNVWQSHLLHVVSPLFKVSLGERFRLLDLGTGGGLPGIPWGILHPQAEVVLMDATQKKINADRDMVERIGLSNISAVWGRAEELGRKPEFAGRFDAVSARAVAPLKDLVKWGTPFLRKRNTAAVATGSSKEGKRPVQMPCMLALKGGDLTLELAAVGNRGGVVSTEVIDLVFHGSEFLPLVDKKLVLLNY